MVPINVDRRLLPYSTTRELTTSASTTTTTYRPKTPSGHPLTPAWLLHKSSASLSAQVTMCNITASSRLLYG
ncbi:hypothetical protein M407DRAFT_244722 [Tulasnella calospora MUT 4182]|uniref:Uncharacterized protein n=1 Tax=Tulasnella calospora MUT 4182 TaxID=1051891 RepID=A0A0C3KQG7_9AGAM|nr:hypothetical protein M407DRAFT_244722 [Tulasnella calospora MUT 4182]